MSNYIFTQKNGSAVVTVTAKNQGQAWDELADIVKDENQFCLEDEPDEDDDDDDF